MSTTEPSAPAATPKTSIYKHMVRGSAWAIATRWSLRSIGLVSTVVLARLLTPEDFGVAATGALTIAFLEGFAELGVPQLVIREQNANRNDFDTAWTVQILQGLFIASLLVIAAPLGARFFGDPRTADVIRVLALSAAIGGTANVGLVLARKDLNFALGFKFNTIVRIARFFVTVGLAFWLRSYWALVLARLLTSAVAVPLSYAMHPYRPRLSLTNVGKFLRFGASIVPMRIGRHLNAKAHVIAVGRFGGTAMLGGYNVASDLAGMLTREIITPVGTGLLPSYAKLSHDRAKYAEAFRYVLGATATLVLPAGLGLWVVAPHVVPLLLGQQWISTIPLVRTLALYHMITALLHSMSAQVLIASGHERRTAVVVWVRLAILVAVVVVFANVWGVESVASGAVVAALVAAPFVVFVLTRSIELRYRDVAAALYRPFTAAVAMVVVLDAIVGDLPLGDFPSLAIQLAVGASAYLAAIMGLWVVAGRPRGLERVAFDFVTRRLGWSSA